MKDNKKTKQVLAITILTSLILIMAVTTAYFAVSVSNTNNERINTISSQLSIVYTDCASSKQSDCANMTKNLGLGESFEKTFKVYNSGTVPIDYKIIFKELTNTFQNNDLVYTIKDLSDNVLQSERPVPYAPNQTTNVNAFLDTISANTTKEFKIVVKLKETTDDQNVNASATYSIKLGLTTQNGGTDNIYNLVADADPNSVDVITKSAPTGESCTNTLAYDGTVDNNLRYVGANPCNYVTFNDEEAGWRIIGVMNNVDDGTGNLETRIKLIRATSLGEYSWDTSASGINEGLGINDWTQADLKNELNGDYLDMTLTENPYWYDGRNDNKTAIFDITKRLSLSSQELIGNAKWYLGGRSMSGFIPSTMYTLERGTIVYSGRPTDWTGKVALMYPSDYGYAVGGTNRISCLTNGLNNFYNDNYCKSSDYLNIRQRLWQLSHSSDYSYRVSILDFGSINGYPAYYNASVHPTVYLNADTQISGGNGSVNNPYTLK